MRNARLKIPLLALAGIGIVLGISHWLRPSGPMYQGKPVKHWVDVCVRKSSPTFSSRNPEFLALIAIGSNAVPYLIDAIQHEPGLLGTKPYRFVYQSLPPAVARSLPAPLVRNIVRLRAYIALASMGPAAKTAVPFLVEQFHPTNRELVSVGFALGGIGPLAEEAIPVLTNAFHSTNIVFRRTAARTLAKVAPDYPPLLPEMLIELKSADVQARRDACLILRELGPRAKSAVAALKDAKADKDAEVRTNARTALHAIEGEQWRQYPLGIR